MDFSFEPTAADREAARADQGKDPGDLVKENLRLANTIANDYRNIPGVELDDVIQQARIALLHAAQSYDSSRGVPFGLYAGRVMRNALNSLYRRQSRISRREENTLDEPIADGEMTRHDVISDSRERGPLPLERAETAEAIEDVVVRLPDRPRAIVRGFMDGKSGEEMAQELGISRQAVNASLRGALAVMRQRLRAQGFEGQEEGILFAGQRARGKEDTMPDADRAGQTAPPASTETSQEAVDNALADEYRDISDEILQSLPREQADRARAFQDAAKAVERRGGPQAGEGAPPGSQTDALLDWANAEGRLIPAGEIDALPLVSDSTSEHEVHYRESDGRAIKRTWPGFYGQIPTPENGRLGRRNASPAEYLRRMAWQIAVFGSDLRLEGVSVSDKPSMIIGHPAGEPSLVISQGWFEKDGKTSMSEIGTRMEADG